MKRFLSILLCLCMVAAILPVNISAEETTGTDETAPMNEETLEMFGFSPDPSTYDTNSLKPGRHIIDQRYDFYTDFGNKIQKRPITKNKISFSSYNYYTYDIGNFTDYTNGKNDIFFTSVAFDPTGCKADNYIARVTLSDNIWGGQIKLSIFDSEGKIFKDTYLTTGWVDTATQIHVWDLEGLIAIDAGDFDGDGKDELAVYTPNNHNETSSGSVHADIFVTIYDVGISTNTITKKQTIDLTARTKASEICEWEYTYKGGSKRYYCLPYVALSADDLNGDGIDDLMATISFSTYYRGTAYKTKYTTSQILDRDSYFASVLQAYEGVSGGKLTQTVRNRVLVTNYMSGYRYVLRNANAVVADVTGEGSNEIVIAGNYTRVTYQDTSSSSTVNSNRGVSIDDEDAASNIIGFTTYEKLKKNAPATSSSAYTWTVKSTGVAQLHYYEEDDGDPVSEPVALCGYKSLGFGNPDRIFLEGQYFKYDNNSGKLAYDGAYTTSVSDSGITNIWIGKAVAGNVANDMFSREALMFTYGYKIKGKDKYGWYLYVSYASSGEYMDVSDGYLDAAVLMDTTEGKTHVCPVLVDNGSRSTYLEYEQGNTEIYYSDIDVLSIMQAPPVYEELNDDSYIGNSQTSFEKSTGTGSGSSLGGALTAGVVTGFEQETSFLGLFKCAGAEYELKLTGTVSYDDSTETTYDYSTGFATSGTTDAVAIFTVPYVRYNCTMFMPEYTLPTEAQYNDLCAFRKELEKNLENYLDTGNSQTNGTYSGGCDYYEYTYNSMVDSSNYQSQASVLSNVIEQINVIESSIAKFEKGGTNSWGEVIPEAVVPYRYSVPQNPMVTTMDLAVYDALAELTPGLDTISDKVFGEGYRPGDPSTYAHDESDLAISSGLLTAKTNLGTSGDGFLSNSTGSSSATMKSQTISVEKSDSKTLGWGAAIENTSVANVAGIKAGFTVCAEINGSSVWTTTVGNAYSATVVDLPKDTPDDYAYQWKLVAYNTKLNGAEVPVVGYLTRLNVTPPPSIAQNIDVSEITDRSATITWEDGNRPADYYNLLRVYSVNGKEQTATVREKITSEDGKYSYTITNLTPANTSDYVLEAYTSRGKKSVPTEVIKITTFPKDFSASIKIDGFDGGVIHRNGKQLNTTAEIIGNTGYDTLYQWQVNDGSGWKNITNQTGDEYSFAVSPIDNGSRIRCAAIIVISANSSCVIYSNPINVNCTKSSNGYNVEWSEDGQSVTVTADGDAVPATVYLKADGANGISEIVPKASSAEGATFDLSGISADETVRLYIWEDNMAPVTAPFER